MIYRAKTIDEIVAEYACAASAPTDYLKSKWGSAESMRGRFRLALELFDFAGLASWLDIGCGAGSFFQEVLAAGHRPARMLGVDVTPEIITQARQRGFPANVSFEVGNLLGLAARGEAFSLVSMVGVLQQCALPPEAALAELAPLVEPGGMFFITTKHLGWREFVEGRLEPEENHSWFGFAEIGDILRGLGLEVTEAGGLLPVEVRRVEPQDSHTIYFAGRRP